MIHAGKVREMRGRNAIVVVDSSRCSACAGKSACMGMMGAGSGERLLEAANDAGARVGDTVEVEFRTPAALTVVSVTFLVPVILMGAGYAVMARGPLSGAIGAVSGLILGLLLSWLANRRLRTKPGYGLSVIRVLETGEALQ